MKLVQIQQVRTLSRDLLVRIPLPGLLIQGLLIQGLLIQGWQRQQKTVPRVGFAGLLGSES
jgi:hypothetical protein